MLTSAMEEEMRKMLTCERDEENQLVRGVRNVQKLVGMTPNLSEMLTGEY